MKNKMAFTLAEVLITIVIIGIVAALTIPSIILSYQKNQTVVQLKKVYNTLSQATNMAIIDHGPIDRWDFTLSASDFAQKYLIPYLKISNKSSSSFTLSDGAKISYLIFNDNQGSTFFMTADINGNKKPNKTGRDIFYLIVNGNNIGFDKFNSYLRKAGFHFLNKGGTRANLMKGTNSYGCNGGYAMPGGNCGFIIQMDGWKISDDYPW